VFYRVVSFCIAYGIVVRLSTHFMIPCALFIITLKIVLSCVKIQVLWDMMFQLVNSANILEKPNATIFRMKVVFSDLEDGGIKFLRNVDDSLPTHQHIPEDLYFHQFPTRTSDLAVFLMCLQQNAEMSHLPKCEMTPLHILQFL